MYILLRQNNHYFFLAVSRSFVKANRNLADSSRQESVIGRQRDLPMKQLDSPLAAADVQGAVVEKGIEVMGKMVDKQLQIIDEAQQKAEDFLKKEVRSSFFKNSLCAVIQNLGVDIGGQRRLQMSDKKKVITLVNRKRCKQSSEPIKSRRKYM